MGYVDRIASEQSRVNSTWTLGLQAHTCFHTAGQTLEGKEHKNAKPFWVVGGEFIFTRWSELPVMLLLCVDMMTNKRLNLERRGSPRAALRQVQH